LGIGTGATRAARFAALCRFTCSEPLPVSNNFAVLQIKPGDECEVHLAGFPAFAGKVVTRQVYLDANKHHIEIQCATFVELGTASVISQTGEWRDKTFGQIARDILGKIGINVVFEGGPEPTYKFSRVSAAPGETIVTFLDKISRSLSASSGLGISFTTNVEGDFVVIMGPNGGSDTITEGKNLLVGREVIYNPSMSTNHPVISQAPGTDKERGAKVTHQPFADLPVKNDFNSGPAAVILSELPTADAQQLKGRAITESQWLGADQITVTATVYGWRRPSGGLWYRDQQVVVKSPSLMMDSEKLIAKSVTFTQDNRSGTRTTLELCNASALGGIAPPIR